MVVVSARLSILSNLFEKLGEVNGSRPLNTKPQKGVLCLKWDGRDLNPQEGTLGGF